MTGYASAQHGASEEDGGASGRNSRLGLEIRSVNSRFLDLSFRLPDELRAHEPALRALDRPPQARQGRGARRHRQRRRQLLPDPSTAMLQRLAMLQDTVQSWLPDARSLSVSDALRLASGSGNSAVDWSSVLPTLAEQALTELLEARAREGKRLATMLLDRIAQLRKLAADATPLVPQLVEQQRLRFMERWKEAMALAEGAVAPEAAQDRARPRPRPLPSASTWPRKSPAWTRTWTRSRACSRRAARSASAWIS
ncbi:YicC/YloC family endoribonuclease [Delftia tsuruhatensis]